MILCTYKKDKGCRGTAFSCNPSSIQSTGSVCYTWLKEAGGTQCDFFLGNLFLSVPSFLFRLRRIRHPYPFSALMTTISGPPTSSPPPRVQSVFVRQNARTRGRARASSEVSRNLGPRLREFYISFTQPMALYCTILQCFLGERGGETIDGFRVHFLLASLASIGWK